MSKRQTAAHRAGRRIDSHVRDCQKAHTAMYNDLIRFLVKAIEAVPPSTDPEAREAFIHELIRSRHKK